MALDYLLRTLVAVTIVSMCCAQCVVEKKGKAGHNVHKHQVYFENKGCWNEGRHYNVGEQWKTDDCMTCTCHKDKINCCYEYEKPILKDKVHCEAILNKKTCKYEVQRKDRSARPCEVESWIA